MAHTVDKKKIMLDGGHDIHETSEDKPLLNEGNAVTLAVFCSFLICMILFMVLWFGRDIQQCDNSFTVAMLGSVTLINQPYYPIVVRGSNTPVRFAIQALGKQINISYGMCRTFDDGSEKCVNNTQNGSIIQDTWVELYNAEPCEEDNSTGLWLQIYSVEPNPIVLMYCFATDDVYAKQCLQRDTAPPMPTKERTPAAEAETNHKKREVVPYNSEPKRSVTIMQGTQQRFMFVGIAFSENPDWNQFTASYAWDPLDGYLPQYLPPNPQVAFCAQTLNFRKLDLSYRACYNDLSTTPGRTIRRCTPWTDTYQQWFINDTLLFMPTAVEGSVVYQIQAAEGPFVAAVGVKPDIDTLCGTDGTGNLVEDVPATTASASSASSSPAATPSPPTGH